MKLIWEYFDDTFSLIRDEKAECGYSVVCTSKTPTENRKDSLSRFSEAISILAIEYSRPSDPDPFDNIHGYLSEDPNVKILEAEPIEYPEGAVF